MTAQWECVVCDFKLPAIEFECKDKLLSACRSYVEVRADALEEFTLRLQGKRRTDELGFTG